MILPVELFEILSIFFPDDFGSSAFESLNDRRDRMTQRDTDVEVDMIFFHSESKDGDVHFLAYSVYEDFESILNGFFEYLSSVLGNPDDVVSTVEGGMGGLAIFHVEFGSEWFTLYLTA